MTGLGVALFDGICEVEGREKCNSLIRSVNRDEKCRSVVGSVTGMDL